MEAEWGRGTTTGPGARMWAAIAKPACWAVKWVHAQEPRPKMAAKTKPCLSQPEAEVNDSAGLGIGEPSSLCVEVVFCPRTQQRLGGGGLCIRACDAHGQCPWLTNSRSSRESVMMITDLQYD
jgi:hypothetical protein